MNIGEGTLDSPDGTFACPVLFLDLVGYSQRPIAEQLRAKQSLNCAILAAVRDLDANDRIILDTGDGLAVNFPGDPEYALVVGLELASALGNIDLDGTPIQARIGINLGPIRLVQDVNGQTNMIGDGINAAQRVMSFARPGQILVSRSYYQLLVRTSEHCATFFAYAGLRVDKHSRTHEIYKLVASPHVLLKNRSEPGSLLPLTEVRAVDISRHATLSAVAGARGWLWNRRMGYAAAVVSTFLLGLTFAPYVGDWLETLHPVATPTSGIATDVYRPQGELPLLSVAGGPVQSTPKSLPMRYQPHAERRDHAVSTSRPAATRAQGAVFRNRTVVLHLAVSPRGEVSVNGKIVGASPPLSSLGHRTGAYRIEIRNDNLQPHSQTLEFIQGDAGRLRHRFIENTAGSAVTTQEAPYARPGRT